MPPTKLDHCVIPITDWERSNAFYTTVMGAELVARPSGYAYRFGDKQLNVHGPGVKPAEVNVDMLFVAIVGICQSFHTSHTLYELALGRKIGRAEFLAQYKVFVGDLLLNGVAQRPPE